MLSLLGTLGFQDSFTLGAILAGILSDCVGSLIYSAAGDKFTAFLEHQGMFVNHDLEKALRRCFLLAQKSITSECRKELVESSQMIYKGLSRIRSLEHEADIDWLSQKLKRLKEDLELVEQLEENRTPIESLGQIGLLLTQEGKLNDQRIQIIRKKLVDAALNDDSVPLIYKQKVEAKLYETMCAYFAFEIKKN